MTEITLPPNLHALIREFEASQVRELHVRRGDFEVYLSKDPNSRGLSIQAAAPAPLATVVSPASPAPAAEIRSPAAVTAKPGKVDIPKGAFIVNAPNLGTFYRAPKPGAPFYVEVGSQVAAGDELCLIEVMKLFTAVRSETAGRVHAVLVEDGAMVEGGQPLFALVRD